MASLVENISTLAPDQAHHVSYDQEAYLADVPEAVPDRVDLRELLPDLSPPASQLECGMCWAIATGTVLDDTALLWGRQAKRPGVSPTVLMTVFPQYGCYGGAAALLADMVMQRGSVIASCSGEDFVRGPYIEWCSQRKECVDGESSDAAGRGATNSAIPTSIPCRGGRELEVQAALYMPNRGGVSAAATARVLKRLVAHVGPVLSNVVVYQNFLQGNGAFARLAEGRGIYVDDVDYQYYTTGVASAKKPLHSSNIVGTHSLCVVGYGVEEDVELPDGRRVHRLPYWLVRNSWGTRWGQGGFARIAAFPFTKKGCLIGVGVTAFQDGVELRMGGTISYKVGRLRETRTDYLIEVLPRRDGSTAYPSNELMRTRVSRGLTNPTPEEPHYLHIPRALGGAPSTTPLLLWIAAALLVVLLLLRR